MLYYNIGCVSVPSNLLSYVTENTDDTQVFLRPQRWPQGAAGCYSLTRSVLRTADLLKIGMNVAKVWRTGGSCAIAHNRSILLHFETKYVCIFTNCRCQCSGIWLCEEAACCIEASVHRHAVKLVAVNSCQ
jgi:hypothetical protein